MVTGVLPFLVGDEFKRLGRLYKKIEYWAIHGGRQQIRYRPKPCQLRRGSEGTSQTGPLVSGYD